MQESLLKTWPAALGAAVVLAPVLFLLTLPLAILGIAKLGLPP